MVRSEWTGQPRTDPSIYVSSSSENNTVQTYISWNGDSRVSQWRVHASQDNTSTANAMEFEKVGFETMYQFQLDWPEGANSMYVWAEGVSGDEVVGTSRQVTLSRDGQGGSVSDQSGLGSGSTSSNSTGNSADSASGGSNSTADDNSNGSAALSGAGGMGFVTALTALMFL